MNKPISFFKMHVCGNDFMVVDALSSEFAVDADEVQRWSDRRKGIGFDQLLVLDHPTSEQHDLDLRIYNSDGSIAEQCGNGCAAVLSAAQALKLVDAENVELSTLGGTVACRVVSRIPLRIAVKLCTPMAQPVEPPFQTSNDGYLHSIDLPTQMERPVEAYVLSLGNPHAVVLVNCVDEFDLGALGTALQNHELFPNSTNVEILQPSSRSKGILRIFERGVGETLACGSGACAAVAAGRLAGVFDSRVDVQMPGGSVVVEWSGPQESIVLECQPEFVFKGILT